MGSSIAFMAIEHALYPAAALERTSAERSPSDVPARTGHEPLQAPNSATQAFRTPGGNVRTPSLDREFVHNAFDCGAHDRRTHAAQESPKSAS